VKARLPLAALLLGLLLVGVDPVQAAEKEKPVKPPTKMTQTLRQDTYKKLEVVQQAFDAKNYAAALTGLNELKAKEDKLNDYEKATLYNLYAAVWYAQDNTAKAIEAYTTVLKQPNLPEGLRDSTLFALAQMYFVIENYDKAVAILKKWFEVTPEPSADAYVLLAQAWYQQQKYTEAEKEILNGLRVAKAKQQAPKENWLALLRAVYYELNDYAKSAKVLEILIALYPKQSYYLQLSGMYGLMNNQTAQLATLHAAYEAGMVTKQPELLNLARLYLVEEAPYAAVRLLKKGFEAKTIETTAETLQLYAQALSFAKEYEAQIPVLEQLAELTGEAKHYVYLGQAQSELGHWKQAVAAYEKALKGKDVDDAASIRMQLGTALFNAGRLSEARRTFIASAESEKYAESASNWIKFVSSEIERREALNGTPGRTPKAGEESATEQQPDPAQAGGSARPANAEPLIG
jgi:tetratricopeptide (TPR) repeat protein